jgi:hypothetical protein
MNVLVSFLLLDFLFLIVGCSYIVVHESYLLFTGWRNKRKAAKALFMRRLRGESRYVIVSTVINGKRVECEKRIRIA